MANITNSMDTLTTTLSIRDPQQFRTLILQLYEKGLVTANTVLEAFDFNPDQDVVRAFNTIAIQGEEDALYDYLTWYKIIQLERRIEEHKKNITNPISLLFSEK